MAIGPAGGIAFLKLNGLQYQLRGEWMIQTNTTENDFIANQDGSIVYTQKGVVPYMEGKLSDSGGLSVQALAAMRGETVTAELNNGKTYTLKGGVPWGEIKLDTVKAEINIKFGGDACFELTA